MVHGEACTRAARRGVVEDGGRWAGGAGKEHDAAPRASLAEKVQELAADAGPLTNTVLSFFTPTGLRLHQTYVSTNVIRRYFVKITP